MVYKISDIGNKIFYLILQIRYLINIAYYISYIAYKMSFIAYKIPYIVYVLRYIRYCISLISYVSYLVDVLAGPETSIDAFGSFSILFFRSVYNTMARIYTAQQMFSMDFIFVLILVRIRIRNDFFEVINKSGNP